MANVLREKNLLLVYSKNFFFFTWTIEEGLIGKRIKSSKFNLTEREGYDSFLTYRDVGKTAYLFLHNPVMVKKDYFMITISDVRNASIYSRVLLPDYFNLMNTNPSNLLEGFRKPLSSVFYPYTITCASKDSGSCPSIELLISSPESDFLNNLKELSSDLRKGLDQDSPTHSNIVLHVGEDSIKAHKMILKARSPVFQMMLGNDSCEAATNEIVIPDILAATMKKFLTYLYTGNKEKCGFEENLELFYAADKYEVLSLRNICKRELLDLLQVNNACSLFTLANRHCDESLKTQVVHYINANFKSVVNTDSFGELNKDDMKLLIRLCASVMENELESGKQKKRIRAR